MPTLVQFSSIEPFVVAENFDRVNQHLSQQGPGLFEEGASEAQATEDFR
jgi:hypothetical protein